ncbi:MAG: hypothetical protein ACRD1N_04745 [Terriglobia bacterium]
MAKAQMAMSQPDPSLLENVRREADQFIRAASDLVLIEGDAKVAVLAGHEWRLAVEFGKLMFEVWSPGRSLAWRIESIAYRSTGRLGLFVRKPGGRETITLELREAFASAAESGEESRLRSHREFLASLQQQFPGWRLQNVSNRTDRECSFSAWYTRGLAARNRAGWAFLALSGEADSAASESALAYGLNWLDWLRQKETTTAVTGLRLFLPASAIPLNAHRASCLDPAAVRIEVFELPPASGAWRVIDLRDFGNVETRLTPRFQPGLGDSRREELLRRVFSDMLPQIEQAPGAPDGGVSLRILGLEVGRASGRITPQLTWGLEHQRRKYRPAEHRKFEDFMREAIRLRSAHGPEPCHELYRMQPERWLESLLVRDITRLDPALRAGHVHPQVPAFAAGDRGVIDILGVRTDGRLAVIELKLVEEIGLPLQALDYWLRVKWLKARDQFRQFGYFPGIELSSAPPVLYLVSPAFRFHSTTQKIVRYLHPSIEVFQAGVNQQWRSGVQVLFRRQIHG